MLFKGEKDLHISMDFLLWNYSFLDKIKQRDISNSIIGDAKS